MEIGNSSYLSPMPHQTNLKLIQHGLVLQALTPKNWPPGFAGTVLSHVTLSSSRSSPPPPWRPDNSQLLLKQILEGNSSDLTFGFILLLQAAR